MTGRPIAGLLLGTLVAAGLALAGCSGGVVVSGAVQAPKELPKPGYHYRSTVDKGPCPYMGRFVPEGTDEEAIDEVAAQQTTCSKFIKCQPVDVSPRSREQYLYMSSSAAAELGVPSVASVRATSDASTLVRVHYTEKAKFIGVIDDVEGFRQCCFCQPESCTGQYIGEFIGGSGMVFTYVGQEGQAGIEGAAPDAAGQLIVRDGYVWRMSDTFEDGFFGFKTTRNAYSVADPMKTPPQCPTAKFFVGVSPPADSEALARRLAEEDASKKVAHYLGRLVIDGKTETSLTDQQKGMVTESVKSEAKLTLKAASIVKSLDFVRYEVGEHPSQAGTTYECHVLAKLPQEREADVIRVLAAP